MPFTCGVSAVYWGLDEFILSKIRSLIIIKIIIINGAIVNHDY